MVKSANRILPIALLLSLTATTLCHAQTSRGEPSLRLSYERVLNRAVSAAAPRGHGFRRFSISELARESLSGDVAHYSFLLHFGPAAEDTVRVHRVVRELAPYLPRRSADAILLAHGTLFDFDATFLVSPVATSVPAEPALPIFLAANGVDVWGVDFRWALVPEGTVDISFMADWGLDIQVEDLRVALATARLTRLFTGNGFGQLFLAGHGTGAQVGYALLNQETQRPRFLRSVKGFVPIDSLYTTDDADLAATACARIPVTLQRIADGDVATSSNLAFFGQLAIDLPDDPSPVLPFLTNAQLALLIGADFEDSIAPGFHRVGGIVDENTLIAELLFSQDEHWFRSLSLIAKFTPRKFFVDADVVTCGQDPSPFADHLGQVSVPILYVGATGGFGSLGLHSLGLLGSRDVSSLIVSLLPPEDQLLDFAHYDLLLADDADLLAWQPILDFIATH